MERLVWPETDRRYKNMKKKILCLAIAAIMMAGAAITVHAESSAATGTVVFDGSKMQSDTADFTDKVQELLPGDSVELEIQLQNTGSEETDWYLSNEIIQSLEDSSNRASGGAYTYRLSYVGADGAERILYDSEAVGGENADADTPEGLNQVGNSFNGYVYLGALSTKQRGTLQMTVGLDGETQGNSYQDTMAELQLNFAVEKQKSGKVIKKNTVITKTSRRLIPSAVRTGDTARTALYSLLALVCGVILMVMGLRTVNRKRRGKGDVQG
jgi:hypothetical protein